jgi:hypothetical protein
VRIGVQVGAWPSEALRLVKGNAGYPYVFGGRGDAVENASFLQAGLEPFNPAPRRSRSRSWQIEYSPGSIEDFYLDEREVGVGQFLSFLEAPDGYASTGPWSAGRPPAGRREALARELAAQPGEWPVTGVTWDEAAAYARWVGKRLPTWVEWEFAVREGGRYRATTASVHAPALGGLGPRGTSGDWTSGQALADLCSSVREWTATPAATPVATPVATEEPRIYPHLWARAHPELLLDPSAGSASGHWIVGASHEDAQRDFTRADPRPPYRADTTARNAPTGRRSGRCRRRIQRWYCK